MAVMMVATAAAVKQSSKAYSRPMAWRARVAPTKIRATLITRKRFAREFTERLIPIR